MGAFGGLLRVAPATGWFFIVAAFASLGLPGLAHFPAEFQIFLGTFEVWPVMAVVVVVGIVVTAGLYLRAIQAVFLGPLPERWRSMPDLSRVEGWAVVPLLVLTVAIGVAPGWLLDVIHRATAALAP
jgi:NADH-quinone oxidoreductase subunit M